MNTTTTESISNKEEMIKAYKEQIKLAEDLEKLEQMPEFQNVINYHFLDKGLKDQAYLLTIMSTKDRQDMSVKCIFAIGFLKSWLDSVKTEKERAKINLQSVYSDLDNENGE